MRSGGGSAPPDETAKLQESLLADPANERQYLDFMVIVSGLHWNLSGRDSVNFVAGGPSAPAMSAPEPSLAPPSLFLVRQTTAFTSLLGNAVLSYVAVALLLGDGILAVRAWDTGCEKSSPAAAVSAGEQQRSPPQPATIFVAKITGASNCRWTDPKTAVETGTYVPLGRTFALNSGWLEITYLIGPKVDLEGPAVYRVDSDNGGYLKQGKSTFRIRLPKWRNISNEKRPVPKCPAFVIHTPHSGTPNAILVTDMDLVLTVDASGWFSGRLRTTWHGKCTRRAARCKRSFCQTVIFYSESMKRESRLSPPPIVRNRTRRWRTSRLGGADYSGEAKGENRKPAAEKAEGR